MIVSEVVEIIRQFAPFELQEKYDNVGLQIGSPSQEVKGVLVTLDITEEVVQEAIELGLNVIVAHHPLIFGGIKKLVGSTYVERTVLKCIKNDIAVIIAHTNADSVKSGVSNKMCEKLGLINCTILSTRESSLLKLVTFIPNSYLAQVQGAVFAAGGGDIGNYSECGFTVEGRGSFKAKEGSTPFVGEVGELHIEKELRFETVFPRYKRTQVVNALLKSHPYEEVAYDIYALENNWSDVGYGMVGELREEMSEIDFLQRLKEVFDVRCLRHTRLLGRPIKRIALCGGSGSDLLKDAKRAKADYYISGDFKYHKFFDADNELVIVDIGHYESEQYTKELFFEILTKKIPTFAICKSSINTNPIKYL